MDVVERAHDRWVRVALVRCPRPLVEAAGADEPYWNVLGPFLRSAFLELHG